jgi:hypothetical protein
LVARDLIEKQHFSPSIIAQGQKIVQMTIGNIIFRDTYLFMGVKLAKLPKTMGLQDTLKKGDFPFLFNIPEHENYIGKWPSLKYYDVDSKSPEEREALIHWHQECVNNNIQFDMKKEMLGYCQMDVRILTQAIIKFSNLIEEKTQGIQPFLHTSTIASCAMQCFRSLYLKEKSIQIIPPLGFRHKKQQSKKALQWLRYVEFTNNISIKSTDNGKEVQFKRFKLDGYHVESNMGFEFYGCYWHGHTCIKRDRSIPVDKQGHSLMDRYTDTLARKEYLEKGCGIKLIEMWECEWFQLHL